MIEERGDETYKQRGNVQHEIIRFSLIAEQHRVGEGSFHEIAEHEKREHVEEQMAQVGMDESAGKEPIPLMSFGNGRGVEDQVVDQFVVGKPAKGKQGGQTDYGQGDGQVHAWWYFSPRRMVQAR